MHSECYFAQVNRMETVLGTTDKRKNLYYINTSIKTPAWVTKLTFELEDANCRSKVGFIIQFPTVCCCLFVAILDSGLSCGYFLLLING